MTADLDTTAAEVDQSPDTTAATEGSPTKDAANRGWRASLARLRPRSRVAALLLVAFVVAVAVLTVVLTTRVHRPDLLRQQAVGQVVEAATSGAVAVLSYSPSTVDQDVAAARSHLGGEFAVYYAKFAQDIVAPAAKDKGVQATAKVVRAAVSDLQPDTATVLLFIDQTTLSKERPDPASTASSVRVSLEKVDGRWLIAKFEPV